MVPMRLPAVARSSALLMGGTAGRNVPWRCFCNAPKVVDTWEDPRGSFEAQQRRYKAELSQMRKQYAAEVAEKQARAAEAHEEKMERLRKANLKGKDPELVAQNKLERELHERELREAAAAYKARKRELGAERYERENEERRQEHQELIAHMAAMEPSWIHPDEVEERIIHALDNPIRIDV